MNSKTDLVSQEQVSAVRMSDVLVFFLTRERDV